MTSWDEGSEWCGPKSAGLKRVEERETNELAAVMQANRVIVTRKQCSQVTTTQSPNPKRLTDQPTDRLSRQTDRQTHMQKDHERNETYAEQS